ncbi:MAG TPA: head-tail adaptor protein [Archangium sp.]
MTNAGAMREVVTVLEQVREQDGTGSYGDTWEEVDTRRAERIASPGVENVVAAQTVARVPTLFRMRWPRDFTLDPTMRLVHRGQLYEIKSVVDETGRRVDALVTCEERVGETWPSP